MTLEPLKTTEPKDFVNPSDSWDLLSAYGDELELVLFDLDSSYTSWWFPKKARFELGNYMRKDNIDVRKSSFE